MTGRAGRRQGWIRASEKGQAVGTHLLAAEKWLKLPDQLFVRAPLTDQLWLSKVPLAI